MVIEAYFFLIIGADSHFYFLRMPMMIFYVSINLIFVVMPMMLYHSMYDKI
jgi:hypothetical protein